MVASEWDEPIQVLMTRRSANTKRRRILAAVIFLVAAGLPAGIWFRAHYYGEPRRFAVVESGILYRSGQPYLGELDHVIDTFGVKTILIVREGLSKHVPDEVAHARGRGVRVVQVPIKNQHAIPDEHVAAFFDTVDDPAARPVLVHCSAGRHRTGYLCALYRIERQGWSVDRAVAEMLSFEPDMDPNRPELKQLKAHGSGGDAIGLPTSPGRSAGLPR